MAGNFTEQEWESWKEKGWKENQKRTAKQWFDVDIPRYTYEGKRCPKEIGWRKIPEIALKWYKTPWMDPVKALKAYNKGWTDPADASHYYYVIKDKSKDSRDEKEIMELYKKGFKDNEIENWTKKGFNSYKVISKLKKVGFDEEEADEWIKLWGKDVDRNDLAKITEVVKELAEWKKEGFTIDEARKWLEAGWDNPKDAAIWFNARVTDRGMTKERWSDDPKAAREWFESKLDTPEHCLRVYHFGGTIEQAKKNYKKISVEFRFRDADNKKGTLIEISPSRDDDGCISLGVSEELLSNIMASLVEKLKSKNITKTDLSSYMRMESSLSVVRSFSSKNKEKSKLVIEEVKKVLPEIAKNWGISSVDFLN